MVRQGLGATFVIASLFLSGCAGRQGAPDEHASTVALGSARCERTAETRRDGFAGPYTETKWTFSAAGSASGPVDAYVTVTVHALQDPNVGVGWYGDLVWTNVSWHPTENHGAAKRLAADPPQTGWSVTGITLSHTDYDNDPTDDRRPVAYNLEARAGESGFEFASDTMSVECR